MLLQSILEQALLFLPFALGVYLSFSILNIPDLTVDGSFVLGAGVSALMLKAGYSPILAIALAMMAGAFAGLFVSLLQRKNRISPLIAGILTLFILHSGNLLLMGRPNLSLLNCDSLFGCFPVSRLIILLTISVLAVIFLGSLLQSRLGLHLRAFGNQPKLLGLMGKSYENYRMIGLALSNALVGLSGALTSQANGYADIGMGTGLVLIGLATVIVGRELMLTFSHGRFVTPLLQLGFCFLGVLIYFAAVNFFVSVGIHPALFKMAVGGGVILCLLTSRTKVVEGGLAV